MISDSEFSIEIVTEDHFVSVIETDDDECFLDTSSAFDDFIHDIHIPPHIVVTEAKPVINLNKDKKEESFSICQYIYDMIMNLFIIF